MPGTNASIHKVLSQLNEKPKSEWEKNRIIEIDMQGEDDDNDSNDDDTSSGGSSEDESGDE